MKVSIYLVRDVLRDRFGIEYQFRERRLVRQNPEDRVIAVIEAPDGSRIRTRADEHGKDQLIVPSGQSFWRRIIGPWRAIPVKYLINSAKLGEHGLSVVSLAHAAGSESEIPVAKGVVAEG